MAARHPDERSLIGQIGIQTRLSKLCDAEMPEITRAAREALEKRFVDEVDPDRELSPEERDRRVQAAKTAYYARLSLRAVAARRRARELADAATAAEVELAVLGEPLSRTA